MLRAILLYLSRAAWARRLVTGWRFAQRASSRFIAGETLEEALEVIHALNQKGLFTSLDHLGENVTNLEETGRARDEYIQILERIHETGAQSNISLKLTQLGLGLNFDLCLENMRTIAERAMALGILVRIDMEDSPMVEHTLEIYQKLLQANLYNVGLVFQSYLYRTEEDMKAVLLKGGHIRLCKGAYNEPPEVAFPKKSDVDRNFDHLTGLLIDHALSSGSKASSPDGKIPPLTAIATHDNARIHHAITHAEALDFPKRSLEFQMLHGIRSDLQLRLIEEGYPVRVYVPFGAEWYPYFVRRLAERPANLWFFLSNLVRRKGRPT